MMRRSMDSGMAEAASALRSDDAREVSTGYVSMAAQVRDDPPLAMLGICLIESGEGSATLRMPVTGQMRNALGAVHGGFIFTLADSAFAYACRSGGWPAVTHHADFTFVGAVGDRLHIDARGVVVARYGRNLVVDVVVGDEHDHVIGIGRFHGKHSGSAT